METFKVELTRSQLWLVSRAMIMLTSPEGETQLRKEYPNLDADALADGVEKLLNKLETAIGAG